MEELFLNNKENGYKLIILINQKEIFQLQVPNILKLLAKI